MVCDFRHFLAHLSVRMYSMFMHVQSLQCVCVCVCAVLYVIRYIVYVWCVTAAVCVCMSSLCVLPLILNREL